MAEIFHILGHMGYDSAYGDLKQAIKAAKELGGRGGWYQEKVLKIVNERDIIVGLALNGIVYAPIDDGAGDNCKTSMVGDRKC